MAKTFWKGKGKPDIDSDDLLRQGETTLVDELAPQAIDWGFNSFRMGDVWGRVWFVYDLPERFSPAKLFNLSSDLWMSFFVSPMDPAQVGPALRTRRTILHGENLYDLRRGALTGMARQRVLQATEEALAEIEVHQSTIYLMTWVIGLWAAGEKPLDEGSKRLEDALRETGVAFHRAAARQEAGVQSLLPLGTNRLGQSRNMTAEALAGLFPFQKKTYFDPEGLPFGIHRHNGTWVLLDPFSRELANASSLILGQSGRGKSVFLKHLTEWAVLTGQRAVVIDLEGEFRLLADDLGGIRLDLARRSPHALNVLDLNPSAEDPIGEGLSIIKGFLTVAIGRPLTPVENNVVLPEAYLEALGRAGILADAPATHGLPAPLLSDLAECLAATPQTEGHELAACLAPYAKGLYAHDFNRQTSVDLADNPLVVFGLSGVSADFLPVRLWQIQNFVWSRILAGERRATHVLVDEGWHLLKFRGMAEALGAMARRFRKHGAALHMATQQVEDLAMNPEAAAIRANVDTAVLFGQTASAADSLGSLFKLAPHETRELPRLGKGEALLIRGQTHIPIYLPVPEERWPLYATGAASD